MGGAGEPALSTVEAALKAGKSVVTANKALIAKHGIVSRLARRGAWRHAEFRGRGRRRDPGDQDAARGLRRQLLPPRLRHPQRHLQLHPHPHGARGPVLRRMSEGRAAARLCRGQSDLRHRRPRHRAEARHPCEPRLRHAGRPESAVHVEGISTIAPEDLDAADELGYRVKLLGVAVRTETGIEQRVHPTMVPRTPRSRRSWA